VKHDITDNKPKHASDVAKEEEDDNELGGTKTVPDQEHFGYVSLILGLVICLSILAFYHFC